jgi:hypothetical protein
VLAPVIAEAPAATGQASAADRGDESAITRPAEDHASDDARAAASDADGEALARAATTEN